MLAALHAASLSRTQQPCVCVIKMCSKHAHVGGWVACYEQRMLTRIRMCTRAALQARAGLLLDFYREANYYTPFT